jgi:glycosyltransferase involved in cell wall biosynthesis
MPRRLLFATDVKLLPLDQGMRVRVWTLLAGCGRGFAVTLVAPPPDDPEHRAQIERRCERVVWLDNKPASALAPRLVDIWASIRAAPGLRLPGSVASYQKFVAALRELDLDDYDLVWAERPHIARLFRSVRERTIIDLDDIEHQRMRLGAKYQRPPARSWAKLVYRYSLYRWMELTWSRSFLATVVCSDDDRRYLEERGCRNVIVVPNGVNESATTLPVEPSPRTAASALRLAFLGNVEHPPNLDGISFFAHEVLPIIREAHPDAVLDVLGPSATAELRTRFAGSVRFHGYVPDLAAALSEYDLLVAPIRFGSGTRVKLLDALACRIPIVSTTPAAEGLPVEDGKHLLLANGAGEFAETVLRLKQDPAMGARLASSGAALVNSLFRSDLIQAQLAEQLDRLLAEKAARDLAEPVRP